MSEQPGWYYLTKENFLDRITASGLDGSVRVALAGWSELDRAVLHITQEKIHIYQPEGSRHGVLKLVTTLQTTELEAAILLLDMTQGAKT